MESTIIALGKQTHRQSLVDYLEKQSLEELSCTVLSGLGQRPSSHADPVLLIRAIILGSPFDGSEFCVQRRTMVLQSTMTWLSEAAENSVNTPTALTTNVMNLLWPEIETLSVPVLYDAATHIVDLIENQKPVHPRLLETLAKVWNAIAAADAKADAHTIIDRLCASPWPSQVAVGLMSSFNEMEITPILIERIVLRLHQQLDILETEEIPPFIYQMLLLSQKGHKRLIISGMCEFFTRSDKQPERSTLARFNRAEGTVMLHLSFAIKQDQELGLELIKYLKSERVQMLETFNMACLLTAARLHRLEETIFDLIKSTIASIYKDTDKLKKSTWVSDYLNINGDGVQRVLLDIAEKSASDWDQVIQSLTKIGMLLIDTATSQGGWIKTNVAIQKYDRSNKQGSMDKMSNLGIDILLRMFQLHDIVRSEILEQITSRIVSRSSSTTDFIYLLERIIKEYPHAIEGYLTNIKDTLDFLSYLPNTTAERLLIAIQPITKENEQFRDGLMLILRKSMFSKDQDGRIVSVHGFLRLLQSQMVEMGNENNNPHSNAKLAISESVTFEVLGLLRRCFSQQADVRATAYDGLGILARQYTLVRSDIFDILYTQFLKLYEPNTSTFIPIRLDICIENALNGGLPRLNEPVPILLVNLFTTMRLLETTECHSVTLESVRQCQEQINSLALRLSRANLEECELDKNTNFDTSSYPGIRNTLYSGILLGCYEAIIEYQFMAVKDRQQAFNLILDVFKKRKELMNLLKENTSNEKGRKQLPCNNTRSVFTLEFISKITQAMFIGNSTQSPIYVLRSDITFIQSIVSTTESSLKMATEDETNDENVFKYCITLGKVYMHVLTTEGPDSTFVESQPKKGNSVLGLMIDALRAILETIARVWPQRLMEYMQLLSTDQDENPVNGEHSFNKIVSKTINSFKDILTSYLSDRTPLYRESTRVMQIVIFLASKFDRTIPDFVEHTETIATWLDIFARERPIEDVAFVKEVMYLLLHLYADIGHFETMVMLSRDIHGIHGYMDLEEPLENDHATEYAMINTKTCGAITIQLLSFLEQAFEDMIWCIGRLKLCAASSSSAEIDTISAFEAAVCQRILSYLSVTSELTKAILLGTHAESLIKVLSKVYKTLLAFVKYKLQHANSIPTEFISVIDMAGAGVTDKMYKFLTVYGQHQEETMRQKNRKSKGKEKEPSNQKEKAKILRESKIIPNLIFMVEQFERHLIQLSRKSAVDLMQYMKRSTSRDFKIKVDIVEEASMEDSQSKQDIFEASIVETEANASEEVEGETDTETEGEETEDTRAHKRSRLL